jgi:hypothetical protein
MGKETQSVAETPFQITDSFKCFSTDGEYTSSVLFPEIE